MLKYISNNIFFTVFSCVPSFLKKSALFNVSFRFSLCLLFLFNFLLHHILLHPSQLLWVIRRSFLYTCFLRLTLQTVAFPNTIWNNYKQLVSREWQRKLFASSVFPSPFHFHTQNSNKKKKKICTMTRTQENKTYCKHEAIDIFNINNQAPMKR